MSTQTFIIRPAGPSDLESLLALAESCPGAPRWPEQTWEQVLESTTAGVQRVVLIVESMNGFAGFGVMGLAGDDAEIESLAVGTAWRRRGIARRLCEDLLSWARTRGATVVSLEVRVSNASARALYESLGLRQIALRRGYYRDPEEDALVMSIGL